MQPLSPVSCLRTPTILALLLGAVLLAAAPGTAGASTYTVTRAADSGSGTLRQAILDANGHAGADRIEFNIVFGSPFIQPASALPDVSEAVYIDGWTQPSYPNSPVVIDGTYAGANTDGLHLTGDGCTIRGLVIQNFGFCGIRAFGTNDHLIVCNYLGVGSDGLTARGNAIGVYIQTGARNVIGGTRATDRNVISGNTQGGVVVATSATDNQVLGNYIGLGADGGTPVPNGGLYGVWVTGHCLRTTIGGETAGAGNVISGNAGDGIWVNGCDETWILGNIIGLDYAGSALRGNGDAGIYFASGVDCVIGGTASGARNFISGNAGDGIQMTGGEGSAGTRVAGNFIGTDRTGTYDRGNGGDGISLIVTRVTIGGLAAGAGNLISGNGGCGIALRSWASGDTVQGNWIGLKASGGAALGNTGDGVLITENAQSNVVGSADPAGRNVISANGGSGVRLFGDITCRDNLVVGNYIGTDVTGMLDRGNAGCGVNVGGYYQHIGQGYSGTGNLISGNDGQAGVCLMTPSSVAHGVMNNAIGTAADGTPLGNTGHGILVSDGSHGHAIGTPAEGTGNTIAYNGGCGVAVLDDSSRTYIYYNAIHDNQQLGISFGNGTTPTPNDPLDADEGPNGLQNYPVLSQAGTNGAWGTLNSTPVTEFHVEVFGSDACDPSGYGEGTQRLGTVSMVTDEDGAASFYCPFDTPAPAGTQVTATASYMATSEFSPCVTVDAAADVADGSPATPGVTGPALCVSAPSRLGQPVRIVYRVAASGGAAVTLGIFDPAGRRVRSLVSGPRAHGTHDLAWDGTDDGGRPVPAGVYLCRLAVGAAEHRARLVLVP